MADHTHFPNDNNNVYINIFSKRFFKAVMSVLIAFCLFSSLFSLSVWATEDNSGDGQGEDNSEASTTDDGSQKLQRTILLDEYPENPPLIDGTAYILYDAQSKTFLVGDDCDTPLSPASTTKVLTILLALENLDLDGSITVTEDMYNAIPESYVRLPLVEGEEIPVIDAIYASMLISANDACSALAVEMGGSIEGFSEMMNEKARELGCLHSNFTNPYGFGDPEHLTSVRDMVLILEAALEYDLFREVATTSSYTIEATNKYPDSRTINNGNRFIATTTYAYEYYIGGKTGYTNLSGHTIVAAAEKDGRVLVAAIFGATHSEIRYENLNTLFNYGFSNYTTVPIVHEEHQALEDNICAQISDTIDSHGFTIFENELVLQPFITTTAERAAGGYSTRIDLAGAVVDPNLDVQQLSLPVIRQYSDGQTYTIGTLNLSISCLDVDAETRADFLSDDNDEVDIFGIITRIVIILVLLIIVVLAVFIYHKRQQRRKSIKNRRKPRIL